MNSVGKKAGQVIQVVDLNKDVRTTNTKNKSLVGEMVHIALNYAAKESPIDSRQVFPQFMRFVPRPLP